MTTRGIFLWAGLLMISAAAGRAFEREFKQTFPVQPGCTVKVDSYRGAIVVVESDTADEVQVALHMEIGADTEEEADRFRGALQLEAGMEDNIVTLRTRNPRETRVRFVWNDKNQMELSWKITVPRKCNVEAVTLQGSIVIGNVAGQVVARVERGGIALKNIDGSIDASTEIGDVVIERCSGPAKVRVLQGLIRTGTMFGPVDLKNSSGDIEVGSARSGITASAEAGDVTVGFPKNFTGDARISTSGGSIRAKIDPAANCYVDASAVWAHVESQLAMEVTAGASGKSKLVGRVGTGGPNVVLHANGGEVRIVPGDIPFE